MRSGSGKAGLKQAGFSRRGSTNSASQPKYSRELYKLPVTVSDLTRQANDVATKVLNGTIGLAQARTYSGLVRNVSQLVTAQIAMARMLRIPITDKNFLIGK